MQTKECTKCKRILSLNFFHKKSVNKGGLAAQCRECTREYSKAWYTANPEKSKALRKRYSVKNPNYQTEWARKNPEKRKAIMQRFTAKKKYARYGLTNSEYEAIIASQGCKCAICIRPFGTGQSAPHVDHDHRIGNVRGILCQGCNVAIGFFYDNPDSCESAARYLRKFQ